MKKYLGVLALFVAVTIFMTFPLVAHMGSSIRDMGDPLLNTWILSWNIHKLVHLEFGSLFDANIFYPHTKTLAYSEHLFPQSLVALPAKMITGNPIFAYNFTLLFAFITTAFGMYLLAFHLTRNSVASTAAGLILAFNPFMIAHLFQMQVFTAGGIPLAFLFLHKFFNGGRTKHALLFALFFILQALANGYYALFLAFFAGLFILAYSFKKKMIFQLRFWGNMALCAFLILLLAGPFFFQYYQVKKEMGFSRDIGDSASLTSFLATSSLNNIYGKITDRFKKPEGELFPGAVAFLLALIGALSALRLKRAPARPHDQNRNLWKRLFLRSTAVISLLYAAGLGLILFRGEIEISLGPFGSLRMDSLVKTVLPLTIFLGAHIIARQAWKIPNFFVFSSSGDVPWFYGAVFLLAFLFTFGPNGPYVLLHRYVPGFSGIRVPARFHVFVMFAVALFAAVGLTRLSRRLRPPAFRAFLLFLPLLILVEYLSLPYPCKPIPVKDEIPAVYKWLADPKNEREALVELPFPGPSHRIGGVECPRVYLSSYHWKKLVNGYSGFFPPLYDELMARWWRDPVGQNIKDLKTLGVDTVIVHGDMYRADELRLLRLELESLPEDIRFVRNFGTDLVYDLLGRSDEKVPPAASLGKEKTRLPTRGWTATASIYQETVHQAFDGRMDTRWDTGGPQSPGQDFTLDLGTVHSLLGVSLRLGTSASDYPRGYRVELSQDGSHWETVDEQESTHIPIMEFLTPRELALRVVFAPTPARYIRITNTGVTDVYYWSIHEIEVFKD